MKNTLYAAMPNASLRNELNSWDAKQAFLKHGLMR